MAKTRVELSKEELGEAIVQFAARKVGMTGNISHSVQMNAVIMAMGAEGPLIVVTLEPLNLTPGGSS